MSTGRGIVISERVSTERKPMTVASSRTMSISTAIILVGLIVSDLVAPSDDAVSIFSIAALGVGLFLGLAVAIEARAGLISVFRADILMLLVLYALTLLEFLFPQPNLAAVVSVATARSGAEAVFLGFAGLAIGRHVTSRKNAAFHPFGFNDVAPRDVFVLFVCVTLLGYLHILLAVNFDVLEALRQMSLPRFSQSWGRGKFGDASALLVEIGALIYLIPPLAGAIFASAKRYSALQKIVAGLVLLFTLYYGFSGGTRNVFAIYVLTFTVAFFVTRGRITFRDIIVIGVPLLLVLVAGLVFMFEFRKIGLSNYSFVEPTEPLYIDHNIVVISQLIDVFPSPFDFLGLEVPFNALIRPIPRVLWPDKPEGLSVGIEDALGVSRSGLTLAATFVGEAYISGGMLAVLFTGLFFGGAAGMWNRVRDRTNTQINQLIYVSGFLCAAISMRSPLSALPAVLPTLALWLYGRYWIPHRGGVRTFKPPMRPST
jgi:oligosaccharide repeat unit polymerase